MGCRTPRALTDSDNPTRASSSKSPRGWRGFGSTSSTGTSRSPLSSRAFDDGRIADRPRPIPRLDPVSPTSGHLLGQLEVRGRSRAMRIVPGYGKPEARSLAHSHVARDHRIENEVGEVLPDL